MTQLILRITGEETPQQITRAIKKAQIVTIARRVHDEELVMARDWHWPINSCKHHLRRAIGAWNYADEG